MAETIYPIAITCPNCNAALSVPIGVDPTDCSAVVTFGGVGSCSSLEIDGSLMAVEAVGEVTVIPPPHGGDNELP